MRQSLRNWKAQAAFFGTGMFLIWQGLHFYKHELITPISLFIDALVWAVGGAAFGLLMRRSFRRMGGER